MSTASPPDDGPRPCASRAPYPDLSRSSFAEDFCRHPRVAITVAQEETDCPNFENRSSYSSEAPFCTPLGFHIPNDVYQTALKAPKGHESSYWQHGLYRHVDDPKRKVRIHYCKSRDAMEESCRLLVNEEILGLDLEWKANSALKDGIKRNVSLIQIASEERICLFHIARFPGETIEKLVAPTFREIMSSPAIIKAGVAIKGDCSRLKNNLGVQCNALFELSHLHKIIKYHRGEQVIMNRHLVALAEQVHTHLQLPLLKDSVQTSNWWSKDLDYEQTKYAASDAYACFQLFHRMEATRLSFKPVPPRPAHAELGQPLMAKVVEEEILVDDDIDLSDGSESCYTVTSEEDVEDVANELTDMSLENSLTSASADITDPAQTRDTAGRTPKTSAMKSSVPSSPQIDKANRWVVTYRNEHPELFKLGPANLRAYHLWHHQRLSVDQVASVLRDPPLKSRTIIDYVCEAIYRANLPADPRSVAQIGLLGVEPLRAYHKQMLRTAARLVEDVDTESGQYLEDEQVGWWKIRKEQRWDDSLPDA